MTYEPKPGVPKRVRELASALGRRAKGKTSKKKKSSAAAANALRWKQYREDKAIFEAECGFISDHNAESKAAFRAWRKQRRKKAKIILA